MALCFMKVPKKWLSWESQGSKIKHSYIQIGGFEEYDNPNVNIAGKKEGDL